MGGTAVIEEAFWRKLLDLNGKKKKDVNSWSPSRKRDIVEERMHLVGRPPDDLLRFLPAELLHGRVIVLLRLRQEHL